MGQKLFITVGFPGSGKSTWARKKAGDENTIIVGKDTIRHMLKQDYIYELKYEPLVKNIAHYAIRDALLSGFNVIKDETHITKRQRSTSIDLLKNWAHMTLPEVVCVWFVESEKNLEYRMRDNRGYSEQKWEDIINNMKAAFQPPTIDEGFVEIIKIGANDENI